MRRLVQAEGFGARIETLNATEAYLGSLPGVTYANVREPLVNTRNLADLIPLNSVWSGSTTDRALNCVDVELVGASFFLPSFCLILKVFWDGC